MNDEILREQIAYYRARAAEYDQWFERKGRFDHGADLNQRWFDEVALPREKLRGLPHVADTLELAATLKRTLNDGSAFQIVKIYYEPDDLRAQFAAVGIEAQVETTPHYFIMAQGRKIDAQ
jgi:hypothetical protein